MAPTAPPPVVSGRHADCHRVRAGPYELELRPSGVAILFEIDNAGIERQLPGGCGYLEALVQFAGEVIRLRAMLDATR